MSNVLYGNTYFREKGKEKNETNKQTNKNAWEKILVPNDMYVQNEK